MTQPGTVRRSIAGRAGLPPRGECSDDEFERWLAEVTERADPFMAWLGVLFVLVVGFEVAADLRAGAARALDVASWAIWAVFAAEFAAKLWLAPRRERFVRRHWLQAAGLVLPALRVLRFLRLLRVGRALPAARVLSSSTRGVGTARRLFRSRVSYLAASAVAIAIAVAEIAFLFERDQPDGVFGSFGDALLWAAGVVLALQGDPVPASTGAHIAMLCGFAVGLVIVASLAGTVGAFLLDRRIR